MNNIQQLSPNHLGAHPPPRRLHPIQRRMAQPRSPHHVIRPSKRQIPHQNSDRTPKMIRIPMPPPLLVPPLRTPVHRRIPPTSIRRINNVVMNQRARLNQLQGTRRPQHRRRILPPIP